MHMPISDTELVHAPQTDQQLVIHIPQTFGDFTDTGLHQLVMGFVKVQQQAMYRRESRLLPSNHVC